MNQLGGLILDMQLIEMFEMKPFIPSKIKDVKVKIGDKLDHQRFGNGSVIEIIDHEKVKVQFDGFSKILLKNFAGFK